MSKIPQYVIKKMIPIDAVKFFSKSNLISIKCINKIGKLIIKNVKIIKINGKIVKSLDNFYFKTSNKFVCFAEINSSKTFTISLNKFFSIELKNTFLLKAGKNLEFIAVFNKEKPLKLQFKRKILSPF